MVEIKHSPLAQTANAIFRFCEHYIGHVLDENYWPMYSGHYHITQI